MLESCVWRLELSQAPMMSFDCFCPKLTSWKVTVITIPLTFHWKRTCHFFPFHRGWAPDSCSHASTLSLHTIHWKRTWQPTQKTGTGCCFPSMCWSSPVAQQKDSPQDVPFQWRRNLAECNPRVTSRRALACKIIQRISGMMKRTLLRTSCLNYIGPIFAQQNTQTNDMRVSCQVVGSVGLVPCRFSSSLWVWWFGCRQAWSVRPAITGRHRGLNSGTR